MLRSDAAIDFLLSVLSDCTQQTAKDLITALAIFRDNETVRIKLESVLSRRNDRALLEAFRQQF
jgi:hypothetical protein